MEILYIMLHKSNIKNIFPIIFENFKKKIAWNFSVVLLVPNTKMKQAAMLYGNNSMMDSIN